MATTTTIRRISRQTATTTTTAPVVGRVASPLRYSRQRASAASSEAVDAELTEILQSIAEQEEIIDAAAELMERQHARLEKLMKDNQRYGWMAAGRKATYAESFSRETLDIDPKQFKVKAGDVAFWGAVKVSVTEAKKVLTEAELLRISTRTPKKSLGMRLKIEKTKTKVEVK